jgi:two-component system response regulator HydG
MTHGHILVVDDDSIHLNMLKTVLKSHGHTVIGAPDGQDAIRMVRENPCDLVLMDVRMAQVDGIEALRRIKDINPSIPVIIMTAYSSVNTAVEAMKLGAYDYLTKPLNIDELKLTVDRAMEHLHLARENLSLKERVAAQDSFSEIIGTSTSMKKVVDMARIVAPTEATVLVTGESETGKEMFARAIHTHSRRKNGPLVTVNCAALTETLLESELFGHEKGTFTGADRKRDGRFMQANKGTIFLDEVGEIPLHMQAKILRTIQEREIQRLGSDEILHVDVRIVAATNRALEDEVKDGKFREDLYYRLNEIGRAHV